LVEGNGKYTDDVIGTFFDFVGKNLSDFSSKLDTKLIDKEANSYKLNKEGTKNLR